MESIKFVSNFVPTKNVRNFNVAMDGLALAEGEGRLGIVYGNAGLGKTRAAQRWHAENPSVYLRTRKVWETNYTEFLQELCRELLIMPVPVKKGKCFSAVLDSLLQNPKTVLIDELEKLPAGFLEVVRDLSDLSMTSIVLIGEYELFAYMQKNSRVWSRTFERVEFHPVEIADTLLYVKNHTGGKIVLNMDCAAYLHKLLEGNFRLAKRTLLHLIQFCNAKQTIDIDKEKIKIAFDASLHGEK